MNNSWIKVYRKTIENGILTDHTAWAVFSWLLLMVDKETGKRTIGRFQMADELKIKPNTLYKILRRLEKKWKVIEIDSQSKYTSISISNWSKYQSSVNNQSNESQMTVKTASIASNTKQDIENKELRREKESASIEYLKNIPYMDVEEFTQMFICTKRQVIDKGFSLIDYCASKGLTYKDYKALLRNSLRKDYGSRPTGEATVGSQMIIGKDGVARLPKGVN